MPDHDLATLLQAIAVGDTEAVRTTLHEAQGLAKLAVGAGTKDRSAERWLADVQHRIYLGDTALHVAAAGHRPDIVLLLLSADSDPRATNRRGAQPLHYAADGHPGSAGWRPKDQATVISVLIAAGADPNAYDLNGTSPLHRAVRNRCAAAVAALIDGGADLALPNGRGSTLTQLATQPTGRGGSGTPAAREQQHEILRLLDHR